MGEFFKELDVIEDMVDNIPIAEMIITPEQEIEFANCTECYMCGKEYTSEDMANNYPVRDHDHISGLYRDSAHKKCNLRHRQTKKIKVIFHNLRGYDSHLITKAYRGKVEGEKVRGGIDVIANTDEKYMSMTIGRFQFMDSLQHLAASLEKLVTGLDDMPHLKAVYATNSELLARKGVYPYEYMDSFDRFNEARLPPIEAFASSLNNGASISQADYRHAQIVWDRLGCNNLGDYHDLYLKTDVLLLTDVFENYRKVAMENYGLDPCHYISAPSLAWDALLKNTGQELELLSDVDMYNFVESGLRGGVSTCGGLRYAKANNPYLKDYDEQKPNSYIMYMDMNNLYGWSMSQPLPTGGFEWVQLEDGVLDPDFVHDDEGYIAEVDLEYPEELHDEQIGRAHV